MPILIDKKCKECSVAGFCWGGCAMVEYIGGMSQYCDPQIIKDQVLERATNNTLCKE